MRARESELEHPSPFVEWAALCVLVALCVMSVPIFLCRHLTPDAVMFDLQARCALSGGVLYQDILEPNLPGVVWIHMLVRSLAGWSSVALRAADLLLLCVTLSLLSAWIGMNVQTRARSRMLGLWLVVLGLYFSTTEWCHCQRDLWLLPPALAAFSLRWRLLKNLKSNFPANHGALSVIEGGLWGIAFWIKPHIAVPALAVLLVSLQVAGFHRSAWKSLGCVILGGGIVGAAGSLWLVQTGAWPAFWEMQTQWNPEYVQAGRDHFTLARLRSIWEGFAPWSWAHVLAIPVAVAALLQRTPEERANNDATSGHQETQLLAALYLGWMAQSLLLQHPFAYVHLPGIVLAWGLLACCRVPMTWKRVETAALLGITFIVALSAPALRPEVAQQWLRCVQRGPSPQLQSEIQIEQLTDWKSMIPVLDFLRTRNIQPGELTAYHVGTLPVYAQLQLPPSTRYAYLSAHLQLFPSRTEQIRSALTASSQRYLLSSLREAGLPDELIPNGVHVGAESLPVPEPWRSQFPFNQPVVFRSGEYVVHRVSADLGPLCTQRMPLAGVTGTTSATVPATKASPIAATTEF